MSVKADIMAEFENDDLVKLRLAGILPKIDIGGELYIIDWRLKELRREGVEELPISIRNLDTNAAGDEYYFFLHFPSRRAVPFDYGATKLPKDVVLVELPYELKLDPIAVAREYGLKDTDLLANFPIQRELKARVTELKDTALADLVRSNLTRRQHSQKKRKSKKRKGL